MKSSKVLEFLIRNANYFYHQNGAWHLNIDIDDCDVTKALRKVQTKIAHKDSKRGR